MSDDQHPPTEMCMDCGGTAGAHYLSCPGRPNLILTVERVGPIIKSEWDTVPELLEAVAHVALNLVGDPEVTLAVRTFAAELVSAIRFGAGFPAAVGIDPSDRCDGCGTTGRRGVAFGAGKPVLCEVCIRGAVAQLGTVEDAGGKQP